MEKNIMANKSIEIVQAISNAVHNKHHGAMGDKQDWRRSDDPKELVMLDGFNVKFAGDKLIISYNSEESFTNAHDPKFERKIEETLDKVADYIKTEYKKYATGTLRLKEAGEVKVLVETVNRRTIKVTASKVFEITNLKDVEGSREPSELSKDSKSLQKETEKQLEKSLKEGIYAFSNKEKLYG
jgi:hypothetical protein